MINEPATVGEMAAGKDKHNTWRKPFPLPECSPQFPNKRTWNRSRVAVVANGPAVASDRYLNC